MRKKGIGFIFMVIVVGAVVGSAIGELIGYFLPDGVVKQFFLRSVSVGFEPFVINLAIITFTFGLNLKINIISAIGVIIIAYFLRWYE
jgi:uncharacterized membrane protein